MIRRIKDGEPLIGIFEIIDDKVYLDVEPIDYNKAVNGVVDCGHLFHRDLVKTYKDDKDLSEDTREFINENIYNPNLHCYFPRGRICYNINTDEFEVYSNRDTLKDVPLMKDIFRQCNIPERKVVAYVDEQHYNLLLPDDLKHI